MATYNLTKQVTNPASSSTQNVSSGDTINFTITLPSGISDTTPEVFASPTNCSLNQTSDTSSPFTFTATNFTSSTYSVQFGFVDTDSNTTNYSHTVSGSVSSSSIVAPTISGTTFLYYNGETRAAFVSGSTYYVQTRINLSSNGSGGTLEYGRNTSSNTVSGASWQASNTWNHAVGGTRYYWASQDRDTAGSFDSTGGVTYSYVSPNTVAVADGNVASGATSKTITITNTTNDYGGVNNRAAEAYSISTVDHGSGEIAASTVSASRIGVVDSPSSGSTVNFTISSSLPGSAGGSTQTYYVYAYRRPDWSGKAVYYKTDSFVLTRDSAPTPTYSINAPASINEGSAGTINITTTNVSNGTTLYWDLDQSTDYSTSQGSVSISSNAASFTVTPTADSTTEGAETDTIRLYTDSARTTEVANDSFTINDTSTASGGSSGGTDGSSTYGLEVTGPNGTTTVFSSNLRQMNAVLLASTTLTSQASVSYNNIAEATDSSKIAVVVSKQTPSYLSNQGVTVTRTTANGGTVTLTNVSTSSVAIKVSIYRIA